MNNIKFKSFSIKTADITRTHYKIDAADIPLGRLASAVAKYLIGKHKTSYTAHMDGGDEVTVLNAKKIAVSGQKLDQKLYYRHSGYPGGIKQKALSEMLAQTPEKVIHLAVKGMLPKNKLQIPRMQRLHVYAEDLPANQQKTELITVTVGKNE
jgi:large subunit ribosomal protein L13